MQHKTVRARSAIEIFLSRPSRLEPRFHKPLAGLERFLNGHRLTPRTLGTNQYTLQSPMDAVLELMDHCKGAIVLGYPQLKVSSGQINGKAVPLKPRLMHATPWNHMEAVMAYAKDLPLLIIGHEGVTGGVFDKGVLGQYIFTANLAKDGWFRDKRIAGAFPQWLELVRR
jgi:hypothetical protein